MSDPLQGYHLVTLALNLPGPVAASRLAHMGARVSKVEPPQGDPLAQAAPELYAELHAAQQVHTLDLRTRSGRETLHGMLAAADLLLTSSRPQALARLELDRPRLQARYPRLCSVAIVGEPPPRENRPGHDLTYMAAHGLVAPPHLPRTLAADLLGAERAVAAATALLLARERTGQAGHRTVALAQMAEELARPLRHGLTGPGALLGGGLPGYNLYRAADGWIALAALEPHFWQRVVDALRLERGDAEELAARFRTRAAQEWEAWAERHDIPLVQVRLP